MSLLPLGAVIAIIAFVGGIGGGLVFPILPALGLHLGIPGFLIGFILASNRIARLVFNLPAGHLYDRLGPRLTLTGALLVETVGMLGFSAALGSNTPAAWLLAGRFVYGIGMAFLLVGTQAAALGNSDKDNRGRQTAAVRVAINTAVPGGLILGGILADLYSDNVAFLTGAAVSLAGAVVAVLLLPSKVSEPSRLQQHASPDERKEDASSAADVGHGFVALLRSRNLPVLASAWSFNFLTFLSVQGALLATLVLLIQNRDVSIFGMDAQGTSGIVMAVMIGVAAPGTFVVGRVIDALPRRSTLLVPSLIGLVAGFAILAVANTLPAMLLGAATTGLSYNSITLPMMALLGDAAGERQQGPAVAVFQWCGDVGGTIGPMLGIEMAAHLGLTELYLFLAAVSALSIVIALWLRGYEQKLGTGDRERSR